MMDFGFLASAKSITDKYLDQNPINKPNINDAALSEEARAKFGAAFDEAYESMTAMKTLSENMRQSYDNTHNDDLKEHINRLGYSIDNRVIDMLNVKLSDDMNEKVNNAMENAIKNII